MKKTILALSVLIFGTQFVLAEDIPQQVTEDNKAIISIQKQPCNEKQTQVVTRNIGCIIIQVNGKVKENDTNSK